MNITTCRSLNAEENCPSKHGFDSVMVSLVSNHFSVLGKKSFVNEIKILHKPSLLGLKMRAKHF